MPRVRYRRRWRPRYRRRFYRRGYGRRFINGSSRSQIRVKVPMQFLTTLTIAADRTYTNTATAVNAFLHAPSSPLYRAYAALYDEVKCLGFKANFSMVGYPQDTPAGYTGVKFYTSIDRRFCYTGDPVPSVTEMKTYSTFKSVSVVANSVAKFARSAYAKDLIEKAQWHDSEIVDAGGGNNVDQAYAAAGTNLNFFNPALFIGLETPGATYSQNRNVYVSIDVMYYFAFRNPKYGGTSAAKTLDNRVEPSNPDDDLPDDGDDIDKEMNDEDPNDLDNPVGPQEQVRRMIASDEGPNLDAPPREPVTSTFRTAASTAARSAASTARRELSRAADNLARRAGQAIGSKAVSLGGAALAAATAALRDRYEEVARAGDNALPENHVTFADTSDSLNAGTGPLPSVETDSSKETPQPPTHAAI